MAARDTGAGALLGTLGLEPEVTRQEPAEADLCFARIYFNLCSSFGVTVCWGTWPCFLEGMRLVLAYRKEQNEQMKRCLVFFLPASYRAVCG